MNLKIGQGIAARALVYLLCKELANSALKNRAKQEAHIMLYHVIWSNETVW